MKAPRPFLEFLYEVSTRADFVKDVKPGDTLCSGPRLASLPHGSVVLHDTDGAMMVWRETDTSPPLLKTIDYWSGEVVTYHAAAMPESDELGHCLYGRVRVLTLGRAVF